MTIEHAQHRALTAATSRRRLLSASLAAASAAALAPVLGQRRRTSAQTPVATPGPTAIPNTIASDASPRFRAVADALLAAMPANGTPGAALGILADGV